MRRTAVLFLCSVAPGGALAGVPHRYDVDAAFETSLRGLEAMGYTVRRDDASAAIDRTRSEMATRALADGYEELLWVDADIAFEPEILRDPELGAWYLSEDYAFCERARQAGHKVMAETSIRLWHHGRYGYSWEDVGAPRPRVTTATIRTSK